MPTTYDYTISTDFSNGINERKLHDEIDDSSISPNCSGVNTEGDTATVVFAQELSAGEQTTLDGLVAAHDSTPIAEVNVDTVVSDDVTSSTTSTSMQDKISITATLAEDNTPIVVTWYCEVRSSDSGTRVKVEVELNDTILCDIDWIPDVSDGEGVGPCSGMYETTLNAGDHEAKIRYGSGQGGKQVQIRRGRIYLRKKNT